MVEVKCTYNKRFRPWNFQIGDLVLKKTNTEGDIENLGAQWEGSYKVIRRVSSRSFYLEDARADL